MTFTPPHSKPSSLSPSFPCPFWKGVVILVLSLPLFGGEEHSFFEEPSDAPYRGYEPAETPEVLTLMKRMLEDAIEIFGSPRYPIRDVWIVRSIPRRHPARLSRSEIRDWNGWARFCLAQRSLARRIEKAQEPSDLSIQTRKRKKAETDEEDEEAIQQVRQFLCHRLRQKHENVLRRLAEGERVDPDQELALVTTLNEWIENPDEIPAGEHRPPKGRKGIFFWKRRDSEEEARAMLVEAFSPYILPQAKAIKTGRGMACCELLDPERGVFVIYLQASLEDPEFFLELAHETAHLLDPGFYDWCVEGANTLFTYWMAKRYGLSWEPWEKRFASGGDRDSYAVALRMMEALTKVVGREGLRTLLLYSRLWDGGTKKGIDLEAWIRSFPEEKQEEAFRIVERYGPILLQTRRIEENYFSMPSSRRGVKRR